MRYWRVAAIVLGAVAALVGAVVFLMPASTGPSARGADPEDPAQVASGRAVYAEHCAACHGDRLQGQPDWRIRGANGRLPAPPHDPTGHTWHHPDRQLFEITKYGLERFAPAGYESDMPAYEGVLGDAEIWDVLAFIKHSWPEAIRVRQEGINRRASR